MNEPRKRHKLVISTDRTKFGDEDEEAHGYQTWLLLTFDDHACRVKVQFMGGVGFLEKNKCELASARGRDGPGQSNGWRVQAG